MSYANVEFTADMRYMVWFELTDREGNGVVWHCAVDPSTGDLVPADGKGFRAFASTALGRANPGFDRDGAYYVGMDRSGNLFLVRPTGPTAGEVRQLPVPPDPTRRAIYPTVLPDQEGGYVFWIKNERVPGGAGDPRNRWVELQYIALENPEVVHVVERQVRPPGRGFAPLDVGFARWMRGKAALTYGSKDENGVLQVRVFDLTLPDPGPRVTTRDHGDKIDPYSWVFAGLEVLLPGMDAQARLGVYTRAPSQAWFEPTAVIVPPASRLRTPALAQSAEPIVFCGQAYVVYQINDRGSSFWDVTFGQAGEIWLSTLFQFPQRQWLLTDSVTFKAEPEPLVGESQVWVFYSVMEGDNPLTAHWGLYRADTPLRTEGQ